MTILDGVITQQTLLLCSIKNIKCHIPTVCGAKGVVQEPRHVKSSTHLGISGNCTHIHMIYGTANPYVTPGCIAMIVSPSLIVYIFIELIASFHLHVYNKRIFQWFCLVFCFFAC